MPLTSEDKVIILSVCLGLLGSVTLFFLSAPPIIISIFLAIGVSALVYRFLGGIKQDTTIMVKTFTISGTLAALVAVALVINWYLVKEIAPSADDLIEPRIQSWTAVENHSFTPIDLKIVKIKINGNNSIHADKDIFQNKKLKLKLTDGDYIISPQENFDFILGKITKTDISSLNFFNNLTFKRIFITSRLNAGQTNIRMEDFPYTFSTTSYRDEFSGYSLLDENNNVIHHGSLQRWQGETIYLKNVFYLIAVIEANHQATDETLIYSKFIIIQLKPSTE